MQITAYFGEDKSFGPNGSRILCDELKTNSEWTTLNLSGERKRKSNIVKK